MTSRTFSAKKAAGVSLAAILLLAFVIPEARASEHAETERFLRRKVAPPIATLDEIIKRRDEWYVEGYYEPSAIRAASRTGR